LLSPGEIRPGLVVQPTGLQFMVSPATVAQPKAQP